MITFWFQKDKNSSKKKPARRATRSRTVRLESLEDRQLLSGGPWSGFWGWGGFGGGYYASANAGSTTAAATTQAATTTALATSNAAPSYGQNVTLTATVSTASGTPTGLVQFMDGTTVIGTARLRSGVATLNIGSLAVSTTAQSITAQYLGATAFAGSTSTAAVGVTVSQAASTTLLSSSGNPVAPGQAVTFTARVVPNYNVGTTTTTTTASLVGSLFGFGDGGGCGGHGGSAGLAPSGTVEFDSVDSTGAVTVLGTATVNNGWASFSTSSLPTGTSSIKAVYKGDTNFAASNSQTISQAVSATLSSARTDVDPTGQVVLNTANTLNITVRPGRSSTSTAAPTGTVTLFDVTTGAMLTATPIALTASTTSTTKALASFAATFTTTGVHFIIATYSGDANYASSQQIIPLFVQAAASSGNGWGDGSGGGRHRRDW